MIDKHLYCQLTYFNFILCDDKSLNVKEILQNYFWLQKKPNPVAYLNYMYTSIAFLYSLTGK